MAKKQAIATDTAAAAPARAAKSKSATPRVRSTRHSKTAPAEPAATRMDAVHMDAVHIDTPQGVADPHDVIARIAYGYWESRGHQHGMHIEDWLRAEQEYRHQIQPALA